MATLYWVGGSGTLDGTSTSNWSTSSGGSPGAGPNNGTQDLIFDSNSFTAPGQTVTANYSGGGFGFSNIMYGDSGIAAPYVLNIKSMDWSAVTNNPTLVSGNARAIMMQGDMILSPNMSVTYNGSYVFFLFTAPLTIDTKGIRLGTAVSDVFSPVFFIQPDIGQTVNINSDINCGNRILVLGGDGGTINTNNHNLSCAAIVLGRYINGGGADLTINVGSSVIDITPDLSLFSYNPFYSFDSGNYSGIYIIFLSNYHQFGGTTTINGGTSQVRLHLPDNPNQTYQFRRIHSDITHGITGDLYDLSVVSGTGALSFNQSNSFFQPVNTIGLHDLTIGTRPFTLYGRTNYPVVATGTFTAIGTAGNPITIHGGSGTSQWSLSAAAANVAYVNVNNSLALGAGIPFDDRFGGIDNGNNTNWLFNALNHEFYIQNTFMVGADPAGDVQMVNIGKSDDGTPIYYELETQEIDFATTTATATGNQTIGSRLHLKKIADQVVVFTNQGKDSTLQAAQDGVYKPIPMDLSGRVNIGKDINLEGHYFQFKWSGYTDTNQPTFEGILIENIEDLGMTYS